jgi:hypothetical protein
MGRACTGTGGAEVWASALRLRPLGGAMICSLRGFLFIVLV